MPTIRLSNAEMAGLDLPTGAIAGKLVRSRRIRTRLDLVIEGRGTSYAGWSVDIASRGVAAHVDFNCPFEQGDSVEVDCSGVFKLPATVVWRKSEGQKNHRGDSVVSLGLSFDEGTDTSILERLIANYRPAVLVVDRDGDNHKLMQDALSSAYHVHSAPNGEVALQILDRFDIAILITDLMLPGMSGRVLIEEHTRRFPDSPTVKLVLTEQTDDYSLKRFVAEQSIFYFLQKPVAKADIVTIVGSAAAAYFERIRQQGGEASEGAEQGVLEYSGRLAIQRDLESASEVATEAILELVGAERAYCHVYDAVSQTMLCQGRRVAASSGLTGFVARTGKVVNLRRIRDASFVPADDPEGTGDEPFVAIAVQSPDRKVLAVFSAVRPPNGKAFVDENIATLVSLATQAASTFSRAHLQAHLESLFSGAADQRRPNLFRAEAFEASINSDHGSGEVLRVSPRWISGSYWVLATFLVCASLFGVFFRVSEVASGSAVIMAEDQTTLTASALGTVDKVYVKPGQPVAKNQKLVDLNAAAEEAELARVSKEFKIQLVRSLREPNDKESRDALVGLRTQRTKALSDLRARTLVAPRAGTVSDVRVRRGQPVEPGAALVSFVNEDSRYFVVLMVDGKHRPLLRPGMPLKLELAGYRYAYQTAFVDSISEEILGPEEADNYLGMSLGNVVTSEKPVTILRAFLKGPTFESRGQTLRVHPGMLGTAEVALRSKRLIFFVFPGLSKGS
jgi:CheY-like chemotaxis protein